MLDDMTFQNYLQKRLLSPWQLRLQSFSVSSPGCKESHFYSLSFGLTCTSPKSFQLSPEKNINFGERWLHFVVLSESPFSSRPPTKKKKLHLPIRQVKNRNHQPRAIGPYFLCTLKSSTNERLSWTARLVPISI